MPFGSFTVKARAPKPAVRKEEKPRKPSAAPERSGPAQAGGRCLNILLAGRNLSIMQEFLCSMNQNMNEALHEKGLSYYTRELEAISDIVEKKKKMEQFFWKFSTEDWTYPGDQIDEKKYIFSISPAGRPSDVLDIAIHCVTPGAGIDGDLNSADAVWLMADGLFLRDNAAGDPYTRYLQDTLYQALDQGEETVRPVCLILSQIEGLGRFDGEYSALPKQVMKELSARCRDYFSGSVGEKARAALIPVQVYGGMECAGADNGGSPVLRIGESGFYQTYLPCGCQSPLFYSIQVICDDRQWDFFTDVDGDGLRSVIRRYYGVKFGNEEWKPEILRREEEA